MQEGLAAHRATGSATYRPFFLALLAESYVQREQFDEAQSALSEALTTANTTGENWWKAELYRLKGELAQRHMKADADAEASFVKALEIARLQSNKALELRTAMSLSRLWRKQGKTHLARDTLGASYRWFTEGFDTADLEDARRLLDELP
jgi:predicted ATPase